MKKILSIALAALLSLPMGAIKVHTIGDSTMSWYADSNPKRGWGMFLGAFFDPSIVTVNNAGHSGRDTRQFYLANEDWKAVKDAMNTGDYLIIQFAHNDEGIHTNGTDNLDYAAYCEANGIAVPSENRGTNPQTTFRDYLRLFISEARAKGVTPILVGPICRNYWKNGDITRKGQHDLGDSFSKIEGTTLLTNQSVPATDKSMSYVEAMRIVGQEENVPFLDLTEATRALYVQYGQSNCNSQLFTTGDNTHLNALAANLVAREAAQLMKNSGILAEYIDIPTTVIANPTSIEIGETYSGITQDRETILSGSGLAPASGTLTITASENLQVSLDKEVYGSTASLVYSEGSLFQKLYIRALYSEAGEKTDSVVVESGDIRIVIPVTATVISLDGGSEVSATWELKALPTAPLAAVCEGPISGQMTLSNMAAIDYNSAKNEFYDSESTGIVMVRFHNSDEGCASKVAWPAEELDENATRYIDFSLTAPATLNVRITGIKLDVAAHSISSMCCRVRAGVENFAELVELKNMTNFEVNHLQFTPLLVIPAGETLHVRVLPWLNNVSAAANNKYLGVQNVVIEGVAVEPGEEGIENAEEAVKAVKFFKNGQLMIEKNGVIYNAQGAIVK